MNGQVIDGNCEFEWFQRLVWPEGVLSVLATKAWGLVTHTG